MSFANEGEEKFQEWLEHKKYSYIYLDQSKDTFSSLFANNVKRPDFLVLIDSIGLIAIDVKSRNKLTNYNNKGKSEGRFTLNESEDTQKLLAFERKFRISVWIVFCLDAGGFEAWHWISLSEIIEKFSLVKSSKISIPFRGIPVKSCKTIGWEDGLFKLFGG
ncbi:MAG: hypothetical protein ACYCSB_02245 [bacterium]